MRTLRIGTRGSALARWQAEHVRSLIESRGRRCELRVVTTAGDRVRKSGSETPGKTLFTKEIEDDLLAGELDLAVHSLKDVAIRMPDGLLLVAVPQRLDPRDGVVTRDGRDLSRLEEGAKIGTGSVRRRSALLAWRRDLRFADIRGNVPSRVQQVERAEVDAVVLAMAGLRRLDMTHQAVAIPIEQMVPAPGQGALAVQARSDDASLVAFLNLIDDKASHVAVRAERAALEGLESGCAVPVGAYCDRTGDSFRLTATVYAIDGSETLSASTAVDPLAPERAGHAAAAELEKMGAGVLIQAALDAAESTGI